MTARRSGAVHPAVAVVLGLLSIGTWGCEGERRFDPPDRDARVADAEARFRTVRFDTLSWASPEARAREGNNVYAAECRNCHGTVGAGDTPYTQSRGLDVPSLIEPDWRYRTSIDSVRHRVFVGHAAGMPTWGVAGITPRQIDAVSFYVLERLRPEMLGEGR